MGTSASKPVMLADRHRARTTGARHFKRTIMAVRRLLPDAGVRTVLCCVQSGVVSAALCFCDCESVGQGVQGTQTKPFLLCVRRCERRRAVVCVLSLCVHVCVWILCSVSAMLCFTAVLCSVVCVYVSALCRHETMP